MSARRSACFAVLGALLAVELPAQVSVDSLRIDAQRYYTWRGIQLGRYAVGADGSMTLLGANELKAFQTALSAEVRSATDDRTPGAGSHATETIALLYHFAGEDQRVLVGAGGVQFLSSNSTADNLVDLKAGAFVRIPWGPVRLPLLGAEVSRDLTNDGIFLESSLRFDYKVGETYSIFLTGAQSWSDPIGVAGTRSLRSHHTGLELRIDIDGDPQRSRSFSYRFEPMISAIWSRYNRDPNLINPGLRFTLVF
jgi:hypothetical protein